ncbi:MAG: DbpA RNA binding domain-containing protein, partial [Luteimonas sp.]|nr:DbpA RNA binding domain-containing protein [Luteimonas sp.]
GVKPGNIVGAIANEADLDSKYIGRIDIRDDHSLIDLPEGMPREVLQHLKKVWVSGQQLRMRRADDEGGAAPHGRPGGKQGGKPHGRPAGTRDKPPGHRRR